MIAYVFLQSDTFADCTEADRNEIDAILSRIGNLPSLHNLACVSLDLGDPGAAIAARLSQGRTVLALSSIARKAQRIAALHQGAHEFLTTGPITPDELTARLVLLATGRALPASLKLDALDRKVVASGEAHSLSERETALMQVLFEACGGFVTHDRLLERVWGSPDVDRQNLRVAINRLRKRIEPEPDMPRYLLAEPAIGYRIGRPQGDHM